MGFMILLYFFGWGYTLIWEGAGEVVVGGLLAVECWHTALRTILACTKPEGKKDTS